MQQASRARVGLGSLTVLALGLTAAGCLDDAFTHGPEYLFREKRTGEGATLRPPLVPLDRSVPAVHQALVEHYLEPARVPPSPAPFATVEQLISALGDPFTFELTPSQVDSQDRGQETSKGFSIARVDSLLYVATVDPGGPAWRAGLRRNDVVERLDALDARPAPSDGALRAALAADPLEVEVSRAGQPLVFTIRAERFTSVTVEEEALDADTLYLRLDSFVFQSVDPRGPAGELLSALQRHPGRRRVVLDLRWNGGGSLGQACDVADLFAAAGTTVAIRDRAGQTDFACTARAGDPGEGRQVAVLLNRGSASSSEVVAAALAGLVGAPLVGETSSGKGVAQTLFDYVQGGRLLMVTHSIQGPGGRTWHATGLTPDRPAALDPQLLVAGRDSQLEAALAALATVNPALRAPAPDPDARPVAPVDLRHLWGGR